MRCIKDLFRYRENDITIALRHDPENAVTQILSKLKQKINEWRAAKEKIWNKIWRDVYQRFYIHALDHRRFYWRTQEKKQLHPKGTHIQLLSLIFGNFFVSVSHFGLFRDFLTHSHSFLKF
jgi:paired amphipathic helix protein Sin3a